MIIRVSSLLRVVVGCFLAGSYGCAGTESVRAPVLYPAEIPLGTYSDVFIASGPLDNEQVIAATLASGLSDKPGMHVRTLDLDSLERLRVEGKIPVGSVAVALRAEFSDRSRSEWMSVPDSTCGPYGCYTQQRPYYYEVPVVYGILHITVYDGPTARVLMRRSLEAWDENGTFDVLRRKIAEKLALRLQSIIEPRVEWTEVELFPVDVVPVKKAIAIIEKGHWSEGRRQLETAARSDEVHRLPSKERAKVYYDLSVARRFDSVVTTDPFKRLQSAEKPLRLALRLDRRSIYVDALRDLHRYRWQLQVLRNQEGAASRNVASARNAPRNQGGIPEPPQNYGH